MFWSRKQEKKKALDEELAVLREIVGKAHAEGDLAGYHLFLIASMWKLERMIKRL